MTASQTSRLYAERSMGGGVDVYVEQCPESLVALVESLGYKISSRGWGDQHPTYWIICNSPAELDAARKPLAQYYTQRDGNHYNYTGE